MRKLSYKALGELSWGRLQTLDLPYIAKPYSVHIPLNMPLSDHLLYCDCALNAYYLPVPPGMGSRTEADWLRRQQMRIKLLSFALGEPAFVPDFRQIQLSRLNDTIAAVSATLKAQKIEYNFTYAVEPSDSTLYVRVTVKNHSDKGQKATIWCRYCEPLESDVFDYHYVSFRWDAARWAAAQPPAEPPVVTENQNFTVEHVCNADFKPEDYNQGFGCSFPYFVHPEMALTHIDDALKLTASLAPQETQTLTLHCTFGLKALDTVFKFNEVLANLRQDQLSRQEGRCQINLGNAADNRRFLVQQYSVEQLMLKLQTPGNGEIVQPCQGGSSERFYVWVWEAMEALCPMVKVGCFQPVRRILEYIFTLQDGGFPPEGKFTSLDGAIGTTGPRWANATGSALLLASDYILYSQDKDFARQYLPKMIRAANWILREVKATRRYNEDGTRAFAFGLMPHACATDGDAGFIYSFTDNYSCVGLEHFLLVLQQFAPEIYAEISPEVKQYRADIEIAIRSTRRADGFVDRKLGNKGVIALSFRCLGAIKFLMSGFSSPSDDWVGPYLDYHERNMSDGLFWAPIFDGVMYIGNFETSMHRSYIQLGQWKQAWMSAKVVSEFTMTPDLYLSQERLSTHDAAFTPWQPNASNSGRILRMFIERLYLEAGNSITLLGSISPLDFENADGDFFVHSLRTQHGMTHLDCQDGHLTVHWKQPVPKGTRIIVPEHFPLKVDDVAWQNVSNSWTAATETSSFTARIAF
ncbi:MAG: hypothetical protein GX946_02655 [Oligosphaeraceae bacterium]|nr:hypothetical protein [Oligosphaeraceae bacterium]